MKSIPKEERRRIFRNELYNLKELGYVSADQYKSVAAAHNEYFSDLILKEEQLKETAHTAAPKKVEPQKETVIPVKIKPKRTPEEIRERNISWSLNIGVIMVLISGLFVATSNWETMSPLMKAGSIALVSALFYGIAVISYKFLKIEKTAFAFVVLGSLFLPIFTLSLGWFELLGTYLSFNGEGRFILGTISSSFLIPVYALLAYKLSSRLFVWFTCIATTTSAAYFLKALGLDADGFYLGLMIFSSMLIIGYHLLRKKNVLTLFTKELALYTQANLILSTLLVLVFFENHIFYGFNLILTSAVYLSMIFISGKKEYHFVFTGTLVYGTYQILENWNFSDASSIGYASLGFVFLLLPKLLKDQTALDNAFKLTSAAVSGLAFIFITAEGILFRSQVPSFSLLIAYLLIAGNFIYLANTNRNMLFSYLSPIFLAAAFFEAIMQLDKWMEFNSFLLPISFIGLVLFTIFGWLIKIKFLLVIKHSSRDIGMVIMFFAILAGFISSQWQELAIILFLAALMLFLIIKIEKRPGLVLGAKWAFPITAGFTVTSLAEEIRVQYFVYNELLGLPGNFAASGLLLLGLSYALKVRNEKSLAVSTFYGANGFYAASLLLTFITPNISGNSLIWFVGVMMSILLFTTNRNRVLSFIPGIIGLLWYMISLDFIHEEVSRFSRDAETILFPAGSWLLLTAAWLIRKRENTLAKGSAWVAHVYLVPTLILSYMIYGELSFWSFLATIVVYLINLSFTNQEWKVKAFLYAAFTALFLALKTGINYFTGEDLGYYAFLGTSVLLLSFWFKASETFKKRTILFLVPFSLLGIASFIFAYPYTIHLFVITILYSACIITLLHWIKWDRIALIPLLMLFYSVITFIYQSSLDAFIAIGMLAVFGFALLLIGRRLYPALWESGGAQGIKQLDGYTMVSLIFLIAISLFKTETFWAQIVHGLLLSVAIWLQRNRTPENWKLVLTFISGAYLLVPYYTAAEQIDIPALWLREIYVLPFIALIIFFRFIAKGKWEQTTCYIQWGILIILSLVLIQDGLASNTIYDAIILGSLSLISMLAGMWLRVKAYFFVGAGVLLLNVILQTRPFWGNLPWWGYLLLAGTILISVASFNEWNKQKGIKGEKTFFVKWKDAFLLKFKNWK
jgi:hypothetical protein